MGCNCKNTNKNNKQIDNLGEKDFRDQHWSIKILLFIFVIVLLPLVVVLFLWIMFNSVINRKPVEESIAFLYKRMDILKTVKENELNEDDEDDMEEIDEENYEYELIGLDKNS